MHARDAAPRDPLDAERSRLFALLAALLRQPPDAGLLARLAALPGGAAVLPAALGALAEAAAQARPEAVEREYHTLFIGVARGDLLPYASYYLTGFLHERPLAELRGDLARLGVARGPGIAEPEDHIAFCCEIMAGLLDGRFPAPPGEADRFLARHLAPWAGRCFADLAATEASPFYRAVGQLGRTIMDIEAAAAALAA